MVFMKPRALPSAKLFDAFGVSLGEAQYKSMGQRPMKAKGGNNVELCKSEIKRKRSLKNNYCNNENLHFYNCLKF